MSVLFHPAARPVRLGFLSPHNPYDRRAFSGTSFFAARALAAHPGIDLRILGGHQPPRALNRLLHRASPAIRIEDMDLAGLDAVIGIAATPLLVALSKARPDLPVIHTTDATPQFLRDVYGWNVPLEADRHEAWLVTRAAATLYSSSEMAARAPDDLGLPGISPLSQPFGINLDSLPTHPSEKLPLDRVKMLFVGLDWLRKGGDTAVATLDTLLARGINAELTLVGKPPERLRTHPSIKVAGFLNKNRPRDAARLAQLYQDAHLLILPSRADCTPMVIAEAMAHGTPVIATDTGGVASTLGGAGTGQVLPANTNPEIWADAVEHLVKTPEVYAMISEAAFDRATGALSWKTWAEELSRIARNIQTCTPVEKARAVSL